MKCKKCNNEMNWLRVKITQAPTYYCPKCGYNHRKPFLRKLIEHPLYSIGIIGNHKEPIVFPTHKDFARFTDITDVFSYHPLKNSIHTSSNLKINMHD